MYWIFVFPKQHFQVVTSFQANQTAPGVFGISGPTFFSSINLHRTTNQLAYQIGRRRGVCHVLQACKQNPAGLSYMTDPRSFFNDETKAKLPKERTQREERKRKSRMKVYKPSIF